MAIPVAGFVFKANGLSVQFTDRSSSIPTSWVWDFGDGITNTTQNPSHVYSAAGIFTVQLTATNPDGSSSYSSEILVDVDPTINLSIEQMVRYELPSGITFDENAFNALLYKWQLHLQILIDPNIPDADVQDETKWPTLVNVLIAKLIVYDMIIKAAESSLLIGSSSSESSSSGGTGTRGAIKMIETGPTKVEFHQLSENIKQLFGNGNFEGSPFGAFIASICGLASRLRIKLYICGPLAHGPLPFLKGANPSCNKTSYRAFWPFGKPPSVG